MLGIRILREGKKCLTLFSRRTLETSSDTRSDLFAHAENGSAYNLLKSLPEYSSTFFDIQPLQSPEKWKEFKPVIQEFKEKLAAAEENTFNEDYEPNIVSSLLTEKASLTDEELRAMLYALSLPPKTPKPKAATFQKLWMGLDEECMSRTLTWNLDTRFQTADLWYKMHMARLTAFHWNFVKRLFRKCDKLNKFEFIRFMFCLNITRELPKAINTYELEHNLHRLEESLSPEEVCIAAMALFKCETRVRDLKLLERLVEKALTKSKDLDSVFVSALAKFTRLSCQSRSSTIAYRLQDAFIPEISRLTPSACTHLALAGSMARVFHKKHLELVLERFEPELETARLKDIERLLLSLTTFDLNCDSLCRKVIALLESPAREHEVDSYGRSLPAIVYYISLRQIYPYELISKVLSTEFLQKYYGRNMQRYQRELLCLDYTMEVECPDYTGNRLTAKVKKSVAKFNLLWLWPLSKERVSAYENSVRTVCSGLSEFLGGDKFAYACNILPQFTTAEVVICMDENQRPVEIPQSFREIPDFDVKAISKDLMNPNVKFHAVLVCNPNFCAVNNPRMILAQNRLQIRQLEKIGYKVHMIMPQDLLAINQYSDTERRGFYNQLLCGNNASADIRQSQPVSACTS